MQRRPENMRKKGIKIYEGMFTILLQILPLQFLLVFLFVGT